jgi:hypothetical protein
MPVLTSRGRPAFCGRRETTATTEITRAAMPSARSEVKQREILRSLSAVVVTFSVVNSLEFAYLNILE